MSRKIAFGFAIAGTFVFAVFELLFTPQLLWMCYSLLVAGVLVHWGFAIVILYKLLAGNISVGHALKSIGFLSLNIPLAVLYAYAIAISLDYARITFINDTGHDVTGVSIEGCAHTSLQNLARGEAQTIWIKIPVDCHVDIVYTAAGTQHRETAVGYLTPAGGIKATYRLGSNRDVLRDL